MCHFLSGKFLIQCTFAFNQLLSSRYGLGLHRLVESPDTLHLLRSQIELVSKLKNVDWPRIAIELRGQCQAHTLTGSKVDNLLLAQGLHFPFLQSGVWTVLMLVLLC